MAMKRTQSRHLLEINNHAVYAEFRHSVKGPAVSFGGQWVTLDAPRVIIGRVQGPYTPKFPDLGAAVEIGEELERRKAKP